MGVPALGVRVCEIIYIMSLNVRYRRTPSVGNVFLKRDDNPVSSIDCSMEDRRHLFRFRS